MSTPAIVAIRELAQHIGKTVTLQGWLYNKNSKGKLHFLHVRDGSGIVQAVMGVKDVPAEVFEAAGKAKQESSIRLTGSVKAEARAPGGVEIQASGFELVQSPASDFPIAIQEDTPNVDKLMDVRHLWLRSKKPHAILRIRSEVEQAIRDFFYQQGFVTCDAPIFTPNACEGTTTLFQVPYFDLGFGYLSQSGQLYMEACAMAHGKVYCFGPVFRAEKSMTRKHLTEFWMVEPEMAYAGLDDVMDLAEQLVSFCVKRALERCQPELKVMGRDLNKLEAIKAPFPRVSYDDACQMIIKKRAELLTSNNPDLVKLAQGAMTKPGDDLGAPDETVLGMLFDRPVMVHRYPLEIKSFYMKPDPQNPSRALCVDVIAPDGYGEIIGGGQREDDVNKLLVKIEHEKLPKEAFEWYLDLRRYGSVPHAGFGLGLERTVALISGAEHVRECVPFPRMPHRIVP